MATVIDTIELGFERVIVYSDGSRRRQRWSAEWLRWVFI